MYTFWRASYIFGCTNDNNFKWSYAVNWESWAWNSISSASSPCLSPFEQTTELTNDAPIYTQQQDLDSEKQVLVNPPNETLSLEIMLLK